MATASTNDNELWKKLEAFTIGDPDAPLSFAARLARENGWSHDFAERVVDEYKRFLYLVARCDHPVTPSEEVDQAWHLHLVYTESYWQELCENIVGHPIHHRPTIGGIAEGDRFVDQYEKTLDRYREHFSTEPPADIWPPSEIRFAPPSARWVDTSKHWLIRKPTFLRRRNHRVPGRQYSRLPILVALATVVVLTGCAGTSWADVDIFDLSGKIFLILFAALIPIAFALSLALGFVYRRRTSPDGPVTETLTNPYAIAYLGGGGTRAVNAALARLYDEERIQVRSHKREGTIARSEGSEAEGLRGLERTVYLALPDTKATRITDLRSALKPATETLRDHLRAAGLLYQGSQMVVIRILASLPFLALFGIGIHRLMLGIEARQASAVPGHASGRGLCPPVRPAAQCASPHDCRTTSLEATSHRSQAGGNSQHTARFKRAAKVCPAGQGSTRSDCRISPTEACQRRRSPRHRLSGSDPRRLRPSFRRSLQTTRRIHRPTGSGRTIGFRLRFRMRKRVWRVRRLWGLRWLRVTSPPCRSQGGSHCHGVSRPKSATVRTVSADFRGATR